MYFSKNTALINSLMHNVANCKTYFKNVAVNNLQDFQSKFGPFFNIILENFNFQPGFTNEFQLRHVSIKSSCKTLLVKTLRKHLDEKHRDENNEIHKTCQ